MEVLYIRTRFGFVGGYEVHSRKFQKEKNKMCQILRHVMMLFFFQGRNALTLSIGMLMLCWLLIYLFTNLEHMQPYYIVENLVFKNSFIHWALQLIHVTFQLIHIFSRIIKNVRYQTDFCWCCF